MSATTINRLRWIAGVTIGLVAAGCGGQAEDEQEAAAQAAPECAPVGDVALPTEATADGLAGTYRLVLVATGQEERRTEGTLTLERQADSLRAVPGVGGAPDPTASMPLYGTAEIAVEEVGGLRLGDLASMDPVMPGVGIYERPGEIMIRLGSETNRRGVVRFDGGFLALRIREIAGDGFRGTWASGVTGRDVTGYFCATRTD